MSATNVTSTSQQLRYCKLGNYFSIAKSKRTKVLSHVAKQLHIQTIKSEDWESTVKKIHSALLIFLGYIFIPCRDVHGILQDDVCMRESETVFRTLTDIFQSPLIHISVSWPVMSIILLQICRVACLPFLWLQETAPQWDAHPAAEAAMSHTSHTWPCFLFTLHVSRQAPPLLHLPNLGTTTWWTPLAFCSDQLTIKKN